MRFLVLSQYYPPEIGASQTRLAAMVRVMKNLGHEVEVVTAMPNHPTGRIFPEYRGRLYCREESHGVTVHRVWLYPSTGAGLRRMINYLSFAAMCLIALFRASRPDYVFVESPPLFLSVPGYLMARRWGAKMIFNVADLWPDSVRELGLMKNGFALSLATRLEKWTYRVADHVNAVTEGIRSILIEKKRVPLSKILFLPNGVDTQLFRPRPADNELASRLGLVGKRLIVYAGTMGYAHGVEVAINAAAMLRDQTDIVFIFVGGGSEERKLKLLAENWGLRNVMFLGPVPPEDVVRLYSLAFAGLSTLRNLPLFEGTRPSKIFPIMASGVPVIYSGSGEGARLIEAAHAGIVTPPEDSQALADTVRQLARNPDLAARLGSNGRAYVEKHLTWSTLVADWLRQLSEGSSLGGKNGRIQNEVSDGVNE